MEPEIPIDNFEVFARGLDHPECCAFDREGYLWAGGEAGQIYRIDKKGEVEELICMGGFCGGLAFSPQDELFVCNAKLGIVQVDRRGSFTVFAEAAGGKKLREPNFLVFGQDGGLFVSDSGDWKGTNGRLVWFDVEGAGFNLAEGFGYANGLALSSDGKTIFMVESDGDVVYRIELFDGGMAAGPAEAYVQPIGHLPDGLCLDEEGNLYVTSYGSHEIIRVSPQKEISLLAHDPNGVLLGSPTNLVFGGADFDEIYVANLGRWEITRAHVNRRGLLPVNLRN